MAERTDARQRRFEQLLEEWDDDFVDRDSVPTIGYDVDFVAERFVLVEESTYGNGKWITLHETPTDAGSYHDSSEYPHDYDIKALIDLDTGDEYDAITDFDTDKQGSDAGELAHDIAEALEAALPEGVVIGEDERAVILQVIEAKKEYA